jgi:S-adenosyl methyltransferase
MSAEPPAASAPDSEDPIGARYPNTARIWNYQLGGKDNFAVDREASEAANAMVRSLGVPAGADTAVESRHLLQRSVRAGCPATAQRGGAGSPARRSWWGSRGNP